MKGTSRETKTKHYKNKVRRKTNLNHKKMRRRALWEQILKKRMRQLEIRRKAMQQLALSSLQCALAKNASTTSRALSPSSLNKNEMRALTRPGMPTSPPDVTFLEPRQGGYSTIGWEQPPLNRPAMYLKTSPLSEHTTPLNAAIDKISARLFPVVRLTPSSLLGPPVKSQAPSPYQAPAPIMAAILLSTGATKSSQVEDVITKIKLEPPANFCWHGPKHTAHGCWQVARVAQPINPQPSAQPAATVPPAAVPPVPKEVAASETPSIVPDSPKPLEFDRRLWDRHNRRKDSLDVNGRRPYRSNTLSNPAEISAELSSELSAKRKRLPSWGPNSTRRKDDRVPEGAKRELFLQTMAALCSDGDASRTPSDGGYTEPETIIDPWAHLVARPASVY